jgi:hypothetical protein
MVLLRFAVTDFVVIENGADFLPESIVTVGGT